MIAMKRAACIAMVTLLAGLSGLVAAASDQPRPNRDTSSSWWDHSIWQDPDRTYQWYPPDPPPAPAKGKSTAAKNQPVSMHPVDLKSIKTIEALRKEVDRLRDQAIMSAKPHDVQSFLAAQQFLLEKSSVFADVARRVVWSTPEIDYSLRRPTDGVAIQAFNYSQRNKQEAALANAMKNYGVYFFLSSTCPYCRIEAQALKQLELTSGLQVLPISLDGIGIPEYTHPLPDNGISKVLAQRYGQETLATPALFLVPKYGPGAAPIPISFGMVSSSEILERIYSLTQTQPGQDF